MEWWNNDTSWALFSFTKVTSFVLVSHICESAPRLLHCAHHVKGHVHSDFLCFSADLTDVEDGNVADVTGGTTANDDTMPKVGDKLTAHLAYQVITI